MMFRLVFLVLAGFALGALFFGGAGSAASGVGFIALFPLLLLAKMVFITLIFGVFSGPAYGRHWRTGDFRPFWGRESRRPRSTASDEGPTETDRFEEWHRMAHAREEVDSWVPESE